MMKRVQFFSMSDERVEGVDRSAIDRFVELITSDKTRFEAWGAFYVIRSAELRTEGIRDETAELFRSMAAARKFLLGALQGDLALMYRQVSTAYESLGAKDERQLLEAIRQSEKVRQTAKLSLEID